MVVALPGNCQFPDEVIQSLWIEIAEFKSQKKLRGGLTKAVPAFVRK